jgi:basic membrane protein A
MKKSFAVVLLAGLALTSVSCGGSKTAEYAVVTDVGQLMDGGFNQGTYEGVKQFAEAHGKTYNYYAPKHGSDATDNDRIEAMNTAIKNGAKVIVAPGFLQAAAMRTVAKANKGVKFVFVDGWTLTDSTDAQGNDSGKALANVSAITYKEEEAGYMAGYAAVKEGYTKLAGVFGGGGTNPACDRYSYGYAQGINAAAEGLATKPAVTISYRYGSNFSASSELQSLVAGYYQAGTEIVFSCGGSMVNSVIAAAATNPDKKIIGVDTDQHKLSTQVLTSAMKGLSASVVKVLGEEADGKWDTMLGGKTSNLGAADDATGLPTNDDAWRFKKFTKDEYNKLFQSIKEGKVTPKNDIANDCNTTDFWTTKVQADLKNITITLDK